jgi:hypothetical protein
VIVNYDPNIQLRGEKKKCPRYFLLGENESRCRFPARGASERKTWVFGFFSQGRLGKKNLGFWVFSPGAPLKVYISKFKKPHPTKKVPLGTC